MSLTSNEMRLLFIDSPMKSPPEGSGSEQGKLTNHQIAIYSHLSATFFFNKIRFLNYQSIFSLRSKPTIL